MSYVDGFVFTVPKKNFGAYKKMASDANKLWKKHGALDYYECKGDDLKPKMAVLTFPKLTGKKPTEDVWFSFIVFKSKAHRDQVNKRVIKEIESDPKYKDMAMPFDVNKMAYGGFKTIVRM